MRTITNPQQRRGQDGSDNGGAGGSRGEDKEKGGSERTSVAVKLSVEDDRKLERFCKLQGAKKGELLGKLVRWYVDLDEEAQAVVLQRPTLISARYYAAMLRDLADDIERRAQQQAKPEDGEEIRTPRK
jgi:hypothetical protein